MNPEVVLKIDALDNTKAALDSVKKNLDGVEKSTKSFQDRLKSLEPTFKKMRNYGTAAVAAIGGAFIKAGLDIDGARSSLVKATGASGEALNDMLDYARAISNHVPQSLTEVADVMGEVNTRLGVQDDALAETTDMFLNFSRVTGTDAVSSVQKVTRLMGDWGVETRDTMSLLDQLTTAGQVAGISIDELADTATNYGVQMRAFGLEQEQVIALLSKWEKEGVSTQKMVGGLSMALGKLSADNDDVAGAFTNLVEEIGAFETEGEAVRRAVEVLGTRAGPDFALAVREGRFEIDNYVEALKNSEGAMLDTALASMTVKDQIGLIRNNILNAIAPTEEMRKKFAVLAKQLIEWTQNNRELIRTIAIAIGAFGGIVAVLGTLGLALVPIILAFKAVALVVAFLAGPIGIIIALLAVIGTTIAYIALNWSQHWDNIKWATGIAVDWIAEKLNAAKTIIKGFGNFFIGIAEGIANAWVWAVNTIIDALNTIQISIPDWVPNIGGKSFGIDLPKVDKVSIPRLAEGGIVTRSILANVGEAGPEAVIPLDQLQMAEGGNITINISGTFLDDRQAARRMGDEIMQTLRHNMRL